MDKQGSLISLFKPRIFKGLLSLGIKGYFVQTGWLNAYDKKQALATDGSPIPWLTYSFLDFIEEKSYQHARIFEYGSGNSTIYFAKRIREIHSVEHDKEWYAHVKSLIPSNAKITYIPLGDTKYQDAILHEAGTFDIVLVDGRNRIACIKNAVQRLSNKGVIILDDSEREKYQEGIDFLKHQGFKHLPFTGIAIGAIHRKRTSVFYKENNIFDI